MGSVRSDKMPLWLTVILHLRKGADRCMAFSLQSSSLPLPSEVIKTVTSWQCKHSLFIMKEENHSVCGLWPCQDWAQLCMGLGTRRAHSSRNWHGLNMRGIAGRQGGRGHGTHHAKARRARHVQAFAWPIGRGLPKPIPMHGFIVYPFINSSILSPTHCPSTHSSHPVCQLILGNHYVQSPGVNTSKKILKIKGIIFGRLQYCLHIYIHTTHTYIPYTYNLYMHI